MENKITPELIEKARHASSPEELLALAKVNEIELSEDEAKGYFEQFNKTGELSDEELDNVAGGGCYNGDRLVVSALNRCEKWVCKHCGKGYVRDQTHSCSAYKNNPTCFKGKCCDCKNCTYEKGLWLCNHPENCK